MIAKDVVFHQMIISGAPGTGKSFILQNRCKNKGYSVTRTIFSPDYTYNTFVGSYFPVSIGSDIKYRFNPGPLLLAFLEAVIGLPNKKHVLIIEETNRGKVNSIFGDIFQLLDRNETGWSDYGITLSPPAMIWLKEQIQSKFRNFTDIDLSLQNFSALIKDQYQNEFKRNSTEFIKNLKLNQIQFRLPPTLLIWGTINPSDSGTGSLDTAFTRRWFIDQIPLDSYSDQNNNHNWVRDEWNPDIFVGIKWQQIRQVLNQTLLTEFSSMREDKCFGPYFLNQKELKSPHILEIFCNKVLSYLWYVVCKYEPKSKIFRTEQLKSFQDIQITLQNGLKNKDTPEQLWNAIFTIPFSTLTENIEPKSYPLPEYWQ